MPATSRPFRRRDAFISKGETPERVAERLRTAAESIRV